MSPRGFGHDDVGAVPSNVVLPTQAGDEFGDDLVQSDSGDDVPRPLDDCGLTVLVALPAVVELGRIGVVVETPPDDLSPDGRVGLAVHVDAQSEPVQQLRTQCPLLGVHGSHQHESARQGGRQSLTLHPHGPGAGVDDEIDEVVVEEVDLVDVEHPSVDLAKQTRLEDGASRHQGGFQVQPADKTILGGSQSQGAHDVTG